MSPSYHDPLPRPPRPEPDVPDPDRLQDRDAREVSDLVRIAAWFAPACVIMLSGAWYFCFDRGWISGPVFALLVVLNFPLAGGGGLLINAMVGRTAGGIMRTLYAAHDLPPPRQYPRQETLVARGQYEEAAGYFRDHLVVEPDDHEARLRLAALLETHLGDAAGAEALYREVRSRTPTSREE